jgi:NADH-quinone oxidoreductase subunit A
MNLRDITAPSEFLDNYLPIAVFFAVACVVASVVAVLPFFLASGTYDPNKTKEYECGFDPFGNARGRFDVKFYLVAILFIVFDLEVAFLIPWSVSLGKIGDFGFYSMMIFIAILTVGLVYEWNKGVLDW